MFILILAATTVRNMLPSEEWKAVSANEAAHCERDNEQPIRLNQFAFG
jgi:hypothetical protein